MALNLNKDEGENQTASNEKKGLNLSKSEEPAKGSINLNKKEVASKENLNLTKSADSSSEEIKTSKSEDSTKADSKTKKIDDISKGGLDLAKNKIKTESNSINSVHQDDTKKKSPLMLIVLIAVILVGVFWYIINRSNENVDAQDVVSTPTFTTDTVPIQPGVTTDTVSTTTTTTPLATGSTDQETPTNIGQENTNIESQNDVSNDNDAAKSAGIEGTVEKKAQDVIAGLYGNGKDRKRALGSEYKTVQAKVNEMYRNK